MEQQMLVIRPSEVVLTSKEGAPAPGVWLAQPFDARLRQPLTLMPILFSYCRPGH